MLRSWKLLLLFEDKLNELVVLVEKHIDAVRLVVVVHFHVLHDFYLGLPVLGGELLHWGHVCVSFLLFVLLEDSRSVAQSLDLLLLQPGFGLASLLVPVREKLLELWHSRVRLRGVTLVEAALLLAALQRLYLFHHRVSYLIFLFLAGVILVADAVLSWLDELSVVE